MPDFFNGSIESGSFTDPTDITFTTSGVTSLILSSNGATFPVPIYGDGSNLTGVTASNWTGGTVDGATTFSSSLSANTFNTIGNVGIGTTSSTYRLQVDSSVNSFYVDANLNPTIQVNSSGGWARAFRIRASTGTTYFNMGVFGSSTNTTYSYFNHSTSTSPWSVTSGLNIDTNNNVGIGTTTPTEKLEVNGKGYIVGTTFAAPATSGTTQTGNMLRLKPSNSSVIFDFGGNSATGNWIQVSNVSDLSLKYPLQLNPNGGNVGIGLTTSPTEKLEVNGTVKATAISATTISGTTFYGDGSGLTGLPSATFTGGTISGATTFSGGLTATTISATTYQNLPSLTPFKQNTTSSLTGTLAETIITSILVPANTFQANDWLRWIFTVNPTANANAKTIKVYFNTSASLVGATQVAQRSLINAVTQPIIRNMFFVNSLTSQKTIVGVTLNEASDEATTGTQATLGINFGVDQYFIISGTLANSGDTITVNGITSQISR